MKKYKKMTKRVCRGALTLFLTALLLLSVYNIIIPDDIECINGAELPSFAGAYADTDVTAVTVSGNASGTLTYKTEYKLFGVLPLKSVTVSAKERPSLYVGGFPFGVRFKSDGVMVVGYSSDKTKEANPGYSAGIKPADVIKKVNGKEISDISSLTSALGACGGKPLTVELRRNGKDFTVKLTPYLSDGKYKTGLTVRDSGAGIGTVTYVMPETNFFGGLGHGICDVETGAVIPMERGTVTDVTINGVVKGVSGAPGELRGSFKSAKTGALLENTSCGVFGMFTGLPEGHGELLPIALKNEVKSGDAYIMCTLDGTGPQKYSIKISDIDRSADGNKCFSVKITDKRLIEKTGGIVQGMSGSPIIQNGKLVGAVTHVLINDPTTGYGIFIENMLSQMGDLAG